MGEIVLLFLFRSIHAIWKGKTRSLKTISLLLPPTAHIQVRNEWKLLLGIFVYFCTKNTPGAHWCVHSRASVLLCFFVCVSPCLFNSPVSYLFRVCRRQRRHLQPIDAVVSNQKKKKGKVFPPLLESIKFLPFALDNNNDSLLDR